MYLNTPIDECEKRDPHGLYKKARKGEIKEFTGVSAPYEAPEKANLALDTSIESVEECVQKILKAL